MSDPILKVNPADNIIVALDDLKAGQVFAVNGSRIELQEDIPLKHKYSETSLDIGDSVYMYGVLIGHAIKTIRKGEKITVENIAHDLSEYALGQRTLDWNKPDVDKWKNRTFMGYHRASKNGQ